ncbi:dnaJ homolog subfamily C member 21-like [Papaver somniferum]|uniref:dnaJ homolog subfamily C member 21-like n=1 Tax=Papaver somniferum TaxID=3469 RepID=UPI000E7040E6|nr:dnaJ homolog subfamily C member 21-like [Papaver somniferum]XP_026454444.1 dnaJ homolog subfamily C member 21-like [Papaver somniferum]
MAAKPEEEEAVRLKTLAEEKYKESEIESALEYARQAESLNQNLDGVSELVTTYSILQEASSSPPNWYKILQVESFSHINTIKKQYRKLALTLHPDKNPSCSASEEAFKHVSEAFRLLSDKNRKKKFDVKLKIAMQSAAVSSNGTHDDGAEKVNMFETKCSSCKSVHQFERRKFIGQSLVCPRCKKSFVAEEMRVNDGELDVEDETRVAVVDRSRRKRKATITDFLDRIGLTSKVPKKKVKFADEMTLSQMQMKAKRKNEEGTVGTDKDLGKEKASKVKETMDIGDNAKEKMTLKEMAEKIEKKKKMDAVQNAEKVNEKTMTLKDMLKKMEEEKEQKMKTAENTGKLKEKKVKKVKEITEILGTEKAMTLKEMLGDIEKKKEKKTKTVETTEKDTVKEGETLKEKTLTLKEMVEKLGKAKGKDKTEEPEKAKDEDRVEKKSKGKKKGKEKKKKEKKEKGKEREERVVVAVSERSNVVAVSERSNDLEAMTVEDSDFYSFDKDRSERCFKKCQIWAAYGDNDGMPRHYGLVDEIVSLNPFKVKVSWLDLQGKGDNVSSSLEGSGCQISCGKFKVDGKTVVNSVNIFSHIVECERVAREIYMIYPKKGSVWALYGGSDRHDLNQMNVVNGCYDIVVILTNYSEMHGLSVAYLDKVKWFKTVFERREIGGHAVRWIEKDNVQLFSHQIPSRKLLGTEALGLPKDCWELDPAALPQDLLVVEKDYLLGAA